MIQFNPFYREDTESLENHLHQESLKGNHIIYISHTFLFFKKGLPENVHYIVQPNDLELLNKKEFKFIRSTPVYNVYKGNAEPEYKLNKTSFLSNYLVTICLLLLLGLSFVMNNTDFFLASSASIFLLGYGIFFVLFELPYLLFGLRIKKKIIEAKENNQIYKKTLHYILFSYLRVVAIGIVFTLSYGLSWVMFIIIFCIIALCFLTISIRTLLVYALPFIFCWANAFPVYNPKAIDSIRVDNVYREVHDYCSTLFVPVYERYGQLALSDDMVIFTYYKVANEEIFIKLKNYLNQKDSDRPNDLKETFYVEGFDYCAMNDQNEYYFEKGYQTLFLYIYGGKEKAIELAKLRMED